MKKLVVAIAAVFAAVAVVAPATAEGPLFEASGFPCGVADADGVFDILTFDSSVIWYDSGKVVLRCFAQGTATGQKTQVTGFECGLGPFGFTTESKNVVGANGHIQLTCKGHLNPGSVLTDTASSSGYGAG